MPRLQVAYLHGFSSNPASAKARQLKALLAARGVDLAVPDLNCPSFSQLRLTAMLTAVDALDAPGGAPWLIVGSSLGGYLATLWAERHPPRVAQLILLAPAFDVPTRWHARHGADGIAAWRRNGTIVVNDPDGQPAPLHIGYLDDAESLPPWPHTPCPTRVYQGLRDDVVPPSTAHRFVRENPGTELVEVDDDHLLLTVIPRVAEDILAFLAR